MLIDGFPQPYQPLQSNNTGLGSDLLVAYVNANAADINGNTVLIHAVLLNNVGLTRILLEDGADVNAQNSAGSSAIHLAALRGHREIVRLLLSTGADPNTCNHNNETPLICAAYAGHASVIPLLTQAGADPDMCDIKGRNALIWAIAQRQTCAVEELLRYTRHFGAKIADQIALNLATSLGHGEICRMLLDAQQNRSKSKRSDFFLDS